MVKRRGSASGGEYPWMKVDPIAHQSLLGALRSTHATRSKSESEITDRLESSTRETDLTYKAQPGLPLPGGQIGQRAPETVEAEEPEGVPVSVLTDRARTALSDRGLKTDFSSEALAEVHAMGGPPSIEGLEDLRHLQWASIDNRDTRDIDQLAWAEALGEGRTRLLVAIADVASAFSKDSALERQAQENTVTVYTPGHIFPMLPEQLSTDWTSLGPGVDRRAVVTELIVDAEGKVESSRLFQAAVNNKAKLNYVDVSHWLAGDGPAPPSGMEDQVRLQVEVGQRLGKAAAERGALEFEAERVLTVVEDGRLVDLVQEKKNVASEAVAHMMIATNSATAHFLHERGFPVFQRIVPPPGRWDRMREVAVEAGGKVPPEIALLPAEPDPAALSRFLRTLKAEDPDHYPQVSQSMLKLMGGGDYVVTSPDQPLQGHFGQGDVAYVHSTAPNRRLPDVIIQRLVQAALRGEPSPYTPDELQSLADRCNRQESAAKGATRQLEKAALAEYLTSQIGATYEAFVTGRNDRKGTFVKVLEPPIQGKLLNAPGGLDVGADVTVELVAVDPEKGHIDFKTVEKVTESPQGIHR